jgi:hypothetical protein
VAQSAHRLHVTLASKPPSHQNAAPTSSCSGRERGSAPAAATSSARAVACVHSPASRAVVTDEACSPPPSSASSPLPSSATSRRGHLLCYLSSLPPPPLLLCHPDAFLLSLPRLSIGDEQRRAVPLALLPNSRRRDAPLVQTALALRRRLSDALKIMVLFKTNFIIIVYFNYNMIYYIIQFKYIFDFL